MAADIDYTIHYNERQRSVTDFRSGKQGYCKVNRSLFITTDVLAAFIGKRATDTVSALFWK